MDTSDPQRLARRGLDMRVHYAVCLTLIHLSIVKHEISSTAPVYGPQHCGFSECPGFAVGECYCYLAAHRAPPFSMAHTLISSRTTAA